MELKRGCLQQADVVMEIIDGAKRHLHEQGIDQWQTGYPDRGSIEADLAAGRGYLLAEGEQVLGYLCADFDGEPAYSELRGSWGSSGEYVVVHRMAFADAARGRGLSGEVFRLVQQLALERGVHSMRIDTDPANLKMRHILQKNGFELRGSITFDGSEKLAFDRSF